MKKLTLILMCVLMSACGGGGDSDDTPFFGGVFRLSGNLILNTCGGSIPQNQSFTLTVNQDMENVVVDIGEVVLDGRIIREIDGFDANTVQAIEGGNREFGLRVNQVGSDDSIGALTIDIHTNSLSCTLGYGGAVTRIE